MNETWKINSLCLIIAFSLLIMMPIGSSAAEVLYESTEIEGVKFFAENSKNPSVVFFSKIQRTTTLMDDQPVRFKGGIVKFTQPEDLPKGVGEKLSRDKKLMMARRFVGRSFDGSGYSRGFEVRKIHSANVGDIISKGLIFASIDGSVSFPMKGPYPGFLLPCEAICPIRSGNETEFFTSVPEYLVEGPWRRPIGEGERFVRLTTKKSLEWKKQKDFYLYDLVAGNPFALEYTTGTHVTNMIHKGKGSVIISTSKGSVLEYDYKKNLWGSPQTIVTGNLISMVIDGAGFRVFYESEGEIFSTFFIEKSDVGKPKKENISLSKNLSAKKVLSDGDSLWLIMMEQDPNKKYMIKIFSRKSNETKWREVDQIKGLDPNKSFSIDALALRGDNSSALYVAITEKYPLSTKIYYLTSQ